MVPINQSRSILITCKSATIYKVILSDKWRKYSRMKLVLR